MFVLAILFLLVFVGGVVALGLKKGRWVPRGIAAAGIVGALAFGIPSALWSQDVGEASVLKDWGGTIVGQEDAAGFHWKAPWVEAVTFDIRNQRVVFVNPDTSTGDNTGGIPDGREIAVVDADGVNSNVDVAIRYSIDPTRVTDIYTQFKNESNLKTVLIYNDLRGVVRDAAGTFHTLDLLGPGRTQYAAAISQALTSKWAPLGVQVEEVTLQQIDAPDSVKDAYALAQQSQIEVQKAQNDLEATKVSAQQQVVQAQAQADANKILSESLTPQILEQRYLDALKEGTVYVVPQGSVPYIGAK